MLCGQSQIGGMRVLQLFCDRFRDFSRDFFRFRCRDGKADNKCRTDVFFAFQFQRAAMFVHHGVEGDREALTGALADTLGGEKRHENLFANVFRNAATVIRYADFVVVIVARRDNFDAAVADF